MSEDNRSSLDIYYPESTYSNYVVKDFNDECGGLCNYDNIGLKRPSYLQLPNTDSNNLFNKYIWTENDNNSLLYLTFNNNEIGGYLKFNNDRVYPIIGNKINNKKADIIIKYPKQGIMDQGNIKLKKINNEKFKLTMNLSKYSNMVFYNSDIKSKHTDSNSMINKSNTKPVIIQNNPFENQVVTINMNIDKKTWNLCFDSSFVKDTQVFLTCKKSNRSHNRKSRNCPYKINRNFPTKWVISEYNQSNQFLIHSYTNDPNNIPSYFLECNEDGGVNVSNVYGSERQIWQFEKDGDDKIYIQSVYFGWYLNYTNESTILNHTLTVRMSNSKICWNIDPEPSSTPTNNIPGVEPNIIPSNKDKEISGMYTFKDTVATDYDLDNLIEVIVDKKGGMVLIPMLQEGNDMKFNVKYTKRKVLEGQNDKYKLSFTIKKKVEDRVVADIKLTNVETNDIILLSGNPVTDNNKLMNLSVKIPSVSVIENFSGETKTCPKEYPYAYGSTTYGEGKGCCIGNPGKDPNGVFDCVTYGCGDGCGPFTKDCGADKCKNNIDIISASPSCPNKYPYPYNGGLYSSDGKTEKTYGFINSIKGTHDKKNYFCCADAISQTSTICKDFVPCAEPPCYENKKNLESIDVLKNLSDIQDISYINLDNGVWKVYTKENNISGINLPPNSPKTINLFADTSRYLQKVRKIGFSFKDPGNTKNVHSSPIIGVQSINDKDSKYSKMYKVMTVDNPGGINIRTSSNNRFPIDDLGLLYTIGTDSDYQPCYSLDTSIKEIKENNNCYGLPEFSTPIDIEVDKKKVPQTKDNVQLIQGMCSSLGGCFNDSDPNIPWCYKRGDLCKGNNKTTDGYICEVDPLVYSWNSMPWIDDNPCIGSNNEGLIYKNTNGIQLCGKNGSNIQLSTSSLQTTFSQYGKTPSTTIKDDYKVNDDISIVGGMKIYGNRYLYGLINNQVYRFDVFNYRNVNTWEQLPNDNNYKMSFITLDNTKQYIYGIPHGTDQRKVFRYDIVNKKWSPYTSKVPNTSALGNAILMKILFTVDTNNMICLDSNGCIWYNSNKIFSNTKKYPIYDIILNNTGTYLYMLMNYNGNTSIVKILLCDSNTMDSFMNSDNTEGITSDQQIYISIHPIMEDVMNNDNLPKGLTRMSDTQPGYSGWSCNSDEVTSCSPASPPKNMGLGDVFGLTNAVNACNKLEECSGFYKKNDDYYLSTNDGLPPKINTTSEDDVTMDGVYIKNNIQNFSSQSMLLNYEGNKIYFISPQNELKYFNIRTCKSSNSLFPNLKVLYITLGPDRELYATTTNTELYKIKINNNVFDSTYSATIVRKFSNTLKDSIVLAHNRPSIFIEFNKDYYYVDNHSKSLIQSDEQNIVLTIIHTNQITKKLNIKNPKCLYFATKIKNNYMNINKGQTFNRLDLEIKDCSLYENCNCIYSKDSPYYNKINGQPAVFSRSSTVNGIKFIKNPYLKGMNPNNDPFTYCLNIDANNCSSSKNCYVNNEICVSKG